MRAWQAVKVKNEELVRFGQAGVTTEQTTDDAKVVEVKFDKPDDDGNVVIELHKVGDLEALG